MMYLNEKQTWDSIEEYAIALQGLYLCKQIEYLEKLDFKSVEHYRRMFTISESLAKFAYNKKH